MDTVTVYMETVYNSSNSTRNLNKNRKKSIEDVTRSPKHRGVLVLLKFQVNSQKLGIQAPHNFEFE